MMRVRIGSIRLIFTPSNSAREWGTGVLTAGGEDARFNFGRAAGRFRVDVADPMNRA
jgi:hypothetical protein